MAKASIKPAVKQVVETVVEPPKVVLELSIKEAQFIYGLIGRCNGKTLYNIYSELLTK